MTREEFLKLKKLEMFKGRIVTGSMVPVIQINEEVVVDVGNEDLKRFDIIVFYYEGRLICHYLWSMNKIVKPILLQSRNISGGKDFPITIDDYLGKVISHKMPWWRKLRSFL